MNIIETSLAAAMLAALAAPAARAETITGTLTFAKANGTAPIANANVEILHLTPGYSPPFLSTNITVRTDASGHFTAVVPFVSFGEMYAINVYASNPAVNVFSDAYPFLWNVFHIDPNNHQIATGPSSVLNLSFHFTDATSTAFFNIADAVQRGQQYAAARRDPRESDTIGQVAVDMQTVLPASYYDAASFAIRLNPSMAMNDFAILHEYAHHLESSISGFSSVPSTHDGCTAMLGGIDVMDPGLAWMEGFADYFPQAVMRSLPANTLAGSFAQLETPDCTGQTTRPPASLEKFVAAALFDLIDVPMDGGDSFCTGGARATDTMIFQILDHEMDIGNYNPALQNFVDAWVARGFDVPMLRRTLDTHGIAVNLPPPMTHYDMAPAANVAIFRPIGSFNSQWWVRGGMTGPTDWGRAGDVPVPADYDGDGLTDLAIWRPGDGTWWIAKSAGGGLETQQWGMNGDIPIPGDYDGDNETDYAVYRPSDNAVYIYNDGCGPWSSVPFNLVTQGLPNLPATAFVGDFDADGVDEPGIYRADGLIYVWLHSGGLIVTWLPPGNAMAMRDYDGDGKTDFAVYSSANATFYTRMSQNMSVLGSIALGSANDVAVSADYDGDGIAEFATWTPSTGYWHIKRGRWVDSSINWGYAGDTPVPAP